MMADKTNARKCEERKTLQELTLLDRFLFAQAAEKPEILEPMLEIILGKDVILKQEPQSEKEIRGKLRNRTIRVDVLAMDTEDNVYNAESQKKNRGNLRRRSRLYNGRIDSSLMEPGETDYNKLNDVYVIMVMPFDLFGRGLYKYTFEQRCREIPELALEDGATRIFLNTRGTNPEDVSEELVSLLQYFETTSGAVAENSGSRRIEQIHRGVDAIKSNEEIGVKWMNEWEEKILDRQDAYEEGRSEGFNEGRDEGRSEGFNEGRSEIIKTMASAGRSPEEIANLTGLTKEQVEELLKK